MEKSLTSWFLLIQEKNKSPSCPKHDKNKVITGYSSNYLKVHCKGNKELLNKLVKVKVTELIEKDNDYEMKGEFINELF